MILFLSPDFKYHKYYKDVIKSCSCFCAIRQTSDDLRDLDDDIKNGRFTLPIFLFNWQKGFGNRNNTENYLGNKVSEEIKLCIAKKSLEFCKEKLQEIKDVITKIIQDENYQIRSNRNKKTNPILILANNWFDISSKITSSIEKYCEILVN